MAPKKILNLKEIFLDPEVRTAPITRRVLNKLPNVPVTIIKDREAFLEKVGTLPISEGKRSLWITRFKGDFFKPCPATGKDYLCCRYWTLNIQTHCPLDCTYCILQNFLNVPLLTVYANTGNLYREIDRRLKAQPDRLFRMGTGELTDSLALDPLTHFNEGLIRHALKRKMLLEIKTKTALIRHLPNISKRNILISWSLNPVEFIKTQEFKSAPLDARLTAAKAAIRKGYRLGFHFDPLLLLPGWRAKYSQLIETLTRKIPEDEVMWISLGSLRFPPALKKITEERFPKTWITTAEFTKGLDGKMRYFRPDRVALYRHVYGEIRKRWRNVFVYFCMENRTVWQEVVGFAPENNGSLDLLFHQSIHRRFPDLKLAPPSPEAYEAEDP